MGRRRLTQVLPFLLPLRRWERRRLFYLKMRFDRNRYAVERTERQLPFLWFADSESMINERSGYDLVYQVNKAHNLRLAAARIDGVLIRPGETFSFWSLVRDADREEPYREGLLLLNGQIVPEYGGGLCQLSSLLHWMFLHTPLTVTERSGHPVEAVTPAEDGRPRGVDATVNEGWIDLRARNDTGNTFQVNVRTEGDRLCADVRSLFPPDRGYRVENGPVRYVRRGGRIFELAPVLRFESGPDGGTGERELYLNECEIKYPLPAGTETETEEET